MRNPHHRCSRVFAAALVLIGTGTAFAADAPSAAVVKPLMNESLAGIPGKEALMLTVEYLPGGASLPHRHDADVFVYVLEGSLIMQVDGQEPVTLHVGQTFHERPSDVHRKSANASATEPAKFLVFIVKDKNKPVSTSVSP